MKPKTMILMAVAITCGLGASYMTSRLLAERTQETEDKVKVLVLKRNMNQGMSLKNIEDIFEEKDFVSGQQPREAIIEPNQLRGKVLKRSLRAGDFIRPDDVLGDKEYTLANLMPEGFRAIGIRVNNESIAGGFAALPHSRVDILSTVRRDDKTSYSQLLLENVLVLAADAQIHRNDNGQAMPANVVTVALKPVDALKVDLARSMGPLSLVLRRFNDNGTSDVTRVTAEGQLNGTGTGDSSELAGLDAAAPPIAATLPKHEPLDKNSARPVQDPVQVAEAKKKGKVFRMHLLEGPNERFVDFMQNEDGTFTQEEVSRTELTPPRSAAKGGKEDAN